MIILMNKKQNLFSSGSCLQSCSAKTKFTLNNNAIIIKSSLAINKGNKIFKSSIQLLSETAKNDRKKNRKSQKNEYTALPNDLIKLYLIYCESHLKPSPYPILRTILHMKTSRGRTLDSERFTFPLPVVKLASPR